MFPICFCDVVIGGSDQISNRGCVGEPTLLHHVSHVTWSALCVAVSRLCTGQHAFMWLTAAGRALHAKVAAGHVKHVGVSCAAEVPVDF